MFSGLGPIDYLGIGVIMSQKTIIPIHEALSPNLSSPSKVKKRRKEKISCRLAIQKILSMPKIKPPLSSLLLLLFLLLTTTTATTAFSFSRSYSQYKTLLSLSHSLLIRVSNLRASRGDIAGSNRAKLIAQRLERGLGLGFWRSAWSVGWDYVKNYGWRDFDYSEIYGAVSELNELLSLLGELTRSGSDMERATWVARNYKVVLRVANSVLQRLIKVFHQSGVLKEVMETVQSEVMEGGLLLDCLELGTNDLSGLVQIVKDMASQFYSNNSDDYYNSDL